jgi:hypothetical protein
MTSFSLQPAQPLAADGATLTMVLRKAGVTKDSLIGVTGPAALTATIWLSRHGYERATYVHADHVAAMQPADALLVPHSCGLRELRDLLKGGGCLRDGGALIAQTALEGTSGGQWVAAVLRPIGYAVEQHISDRGREIYIARRLGVGGLEQAA